jgi:glycine/serine hydroxymethyltransferase
LRWSKHGSIDDTRHGPCNEFDTRGSECHPYCLGTPALTTRGFVEADFEKVADMVVKGFEITKKLKVGLDKLSYLSFFGQFARRSTSKYSSSTPR